MHWRILTLGILGGTLGLVAEAAAYGLGDAGQWIPSTKPVSRWFGAISISSRR